jgi:hypothetical protein
MGALGRHRAARRIALALLAGLASCGIEPADDVIRPAGTGTQALTAPAPGLIQRIANAPFSTAYQGERRVELNLYDAGVPVQFVLRERVSADGHGQFAVDPIELSEPPLPDSERDLFLVMQKVREGLMYRYRDFRVRNVALFLQNYSVHDSGQTVQVAGRSCAELAIARLDHNGLEYKVAVDPPTGLVLRAEARTPEQALVSLLEYTALDLAPDLSNVAWHQPVTGETPFVIGPDTAELVGFRPRLPRVLPLGYELEESTLVHDALEGSKWVRMVYGDGVEEVFFLHGGEARPPQSPLPSFHGVGADTVQVVDCKPWTAAQGAVNGERFIVLGKVDRHELLGMIESAAH